MHLNRSYPGDVTCISSNLKDYIGRISIYFLLSFDYFYCLDLVKCYSRE